MKRNGTFNAEIKCRFDRNPAPFRTPLGCVLTTAEPLGASFRFGLLRNPSEWEQGPRCPKDLPRQGNCPRTKIPYESVFSNIFRMNVFHASYSTVGA